MTDNIIKKGSFVEITYSISDTDGNLLERIDLPINYIHQHDSGMYPVIEKALDGHKAGDEVTVRLTPEEGFGEPDPNLTFTDDIENVPPQFHQVGAEVEMQDSQGNVKTFYVSKIENGKLTVDGNHPFAGKTLDFTVNVISVRDATSDELSGVIPTGRAAGLPSKGIDPAVDKKQIN